MFNKHTYNTYAFRPKRTASLYLVYPRVRCVMLKCALKLSLMINCVRFCNISTIFVMNRETLQSFSVDNFNLLVNFGVIIVTFFYFLGQVNFLNVAKFVCFGSSVEFCRLITKWIHKFIMFVCTEISIQKILNFFQIL